METARRNFLKFLVFALNGMLGLLAGTPVAGYLLGPLFRRRAQQWAEAGAVSEFGAEPKRKRLQYISNAGFREVPKAEGVWIVAEGGQITVFSAECPHVGCNVTWKGDTPERSHFFCPCHGGEFDKTGKVLAGPPPRPLTRKGTKIENGKLLVEV